MRRALLCCVADNCNANSSNVVSYVGGNYNQNRNYGPFYFNMNTASNTNSNIGARFLVSIIAERPSGRSAFSGTVKPTPLGEKFADQDAAQ